MNHKHAMREYMRQQFLTGSPSITNSNLTEPISSASNCQSETMCFRSMELDLLGCRRII